MAVADKVQSAAEQLPPANRAGGLVKPGHFQMGKVLVCSVHQPLQSLQRN